MKQIVKVSEFSCEDFTFAYLQHRTLVAHAKNALQIKRNDSKIKSRRLHEMYSCISFACGQNVRVKDNLLSGNFLTAQGVGRWHYQQRFSRSITKIYEQLRDARLLWSLALFLVI